MKKLSIFLKGELMIFYTNSVKHLAEKISLKIGKFIIKKFNDGEIYLRIEEDVAGKDVWVLAGTPPPAENFLELFFLLDALNRAGANVNLFFTYFGYARQDRILLSGEPISAEVICNFLKIFRIKNIKILHPHSPLLSNFLNFEKYYPVDIVAPIAKQYDLLVAPDTGAENFICQVANVCNKPFFSFSKMHPAQEEVKIILPEKFNVDIKEKKVLILDDMISTGKTVVGVCKFLKEFGAKEVDVFATHALFSQKNLIDLKKYFKNIYVTNSLYREENDLKIVDLVPMIENIIKRVS